MAVDLVNPVLTVDVIVTKVRFTPEGYAAGIRHIVEKMNLAIAALDIPLRRWLADSRGLHLSSEPSVACGAFRHLQASRS